MILAGDMGTTSAPQVPDRLEDGAFMAASTEKARCTALTRTIEGEVVVPLSAAFLGDAPDKPSLRVEPVVQQVYR